MFKVFADGLSTGMLLQFALGPVFFLILNITVRRTPFDGLFAVLAVAIADYIYIILALFGAGKILENRKYKKISGIAGSLILIILGMIIIFSQFQSGQNLTEKPGTYSDYYDSFIKAFILTISNPVTVVFWTGIFSTKALEKQYSKRETAVFGVSAGTATLLFLGFVVVLFSLVKASIPSVIIYGSNYIVGAVITAYGIIRIIKLLRNTNSS
jgi:threonine/homoserine/homoserine lactone efflux protein